MDNPLPFKGRGGDGVEYSYNAFLPLSFSPPDFHQKKLGRIGSAVRNRSSSSWS